MSSKGGQFHWCQSMEVERHPFVCVDAAAGGKRVQEAVINTSITKRVENTGHHFTLRLVNFSLASSAAGVAGVAGVAGDGSLIFGRSFTDWAPEPSPSLPAVWPQIRMLRKLLHHFFLYLSNSPPFLFDGQHKNDEKIRQKIPKSRNNRVTRPSPLSSPPTQTSACDRSTCMENWLRPPLAAIDSGPLLQVKIYWLASRWPKPTSDYRIQLFIYWAQKILSSRQKGGAEWQAYRKASDTSRLSIEQSAHNDLLPPHFHVVPPLKIWPLFVSWWLTIFHQFFSFFVGCLTTSIECAFNVVKVYAFGRSKSKWSTDHR